MKRGTNLLKAKIPLPLDDATLGVIMIYMLIGMWVWSEYSSLIGIALLVNAVLSSVVGIVARSMGKKEWNVIVLGLILGPVGALAGMIAAPQKTITK